MPSTPYPRSTLKKLIRAHSDRPLSRNADILVFLDYLLFMQTILREASIASRHSASGLGLSSSSDIVAGAGRRRIGSKAKAGGGIDARSVRKVRDLCLAKFKG